MHPHLGCRVRARVRGAGGAKTQPGNRCSRGGRDTGPSHYTTATTLLHYSGSGLIEGYPELPGPG